MYFNIALKNVRKSIKDYSIYFLTLTIAVAIFYSFNSIESQQALRDMKISGKSYVEIFTQMISLTSVFVSIILASLILYANKFLIKKRNRELGIYMTLGMSKNEISKILIYETLLVGILSLLAGIILGIFISQGLSLLTLNLFEINLSEFKFIISIFAILKSIIYFGIMFLFVMIFNSYIISKYKIIDLLNIGKKVENIKTKNPIIYLLIFLLCTISLFFAYKLVLDAGLEPRDIKFKISILLGIIGTFLFFYSLSGVTLYVVKNVKYIYFSKLNIFTIKQMDSKIKTNFISMSIVCLILFLTIGVLSTGFSYKEALESGLEDATPFDASATMFVDEKSKHKDLEKVFNNLNFKFNTEDKLVFYNEYRSNEKIYDIIPIASKDKIESYATFIKVSDYNNIRKLNNQEVVKLDKNEVLVLSNYDNILPFIEQYIANNDTLKLDGNIYKIKNKSVIKENLKTYFMKNNIFTVVINDEFCNEDNLISSNININFNSENSDSKIAFEKLMNDYRKDNIDYEKYSFVLGETRDMIYDESKSMSTSILFVGIYLGIVFLISSMTILALQQLSEANDSIDRYLSLKRIGVNNNSISKTIFTQTLIYFTIPIILAFIHSIIGIKVANDFILMYNKPDISSSSIATAIFLIIAYLIYFYTTYISYKNIVLQKIK